MADLPAKVPAQIAKRLRTPRESHLDEGFPSVADPKNLYRVMNALVSRESFTPNIPRAVVENAHSSQLLPPEAHRGKVGELALAVIEYESAYDPANERALASQPAARGPGDFLTRAEQLDKRGHTDAALDMIYDQIDEMLIAKRFETVDRILLDTNVRKYSADVLLALLTITLAARLHLARRSEFFERTKRELQDRGIANENLLVGLE